MARFKRGFSDPNFAAGGKSEYDRAMEAIEHAMLGLLRDDYREELTEQQIKFIADQSARRAMVALDALK